MKNAEDKLLRLPPRPTGQRLVVAKHSMPNCSKRWNDLPLCCRHVARLLGCSERTVSNQLAAGTPIHVVRDMAAHRSLAVTALYAHHTDEARRAAAQRVQIHVGAKADPVQTVDRFDTRIDTKLEARSRKAAESVVGHLGFEPRANGLRIHCSTS
jgi:hypothetical protein